MEVMQITKRFCEGLHVNKKMAHNSCSCCDIAEIRALLGSY